MRQKQVLKKLQEQELKRLSKKFFWNQKVKEIFLFILAVLGFIGMTYIIGLFALSLNFFESEGIQQTPFSVGLYSMLILLMIFLLSYFMGGLIWLCLKAWIESNKEKAEEKAKRELGI